MTNTLLDLSEHTDLRLVGQMAGEILAEANKLGVPVFMAGAMARDLILAYGYGINTGRKTEDVDWAMSVENWDQFEALKTALVASARFSINKHAHRLRYRQSVPVDLMPFGGIEDDQGVISWPPDHHTVMTVLGFKDAYQNSITIRLPGDVDIQVVSLPGLALLKLLAWNERHLEFPMKDAHDFALIARHYIDAGNQERLYDEFAILHEDPEFDYELASARMLGHDIGRVFGEVPRMAAVDILMRETDVGGHLSLVTAMPMADDRALAILNNLRKSLIERDSR
jgi:predicted nucleotidyltransferase